MEMQLVNLSLLIGGTVLLFCNAQHEDADFGVTVHYPASEISGLEGNWNTTQVPNATHPAGSTLTGMDYLRTSHSRNTPKQEKIPFNTTRLTPLFAETTNDNYTKTTATIKPSNCNTDKYTTGIMICVIIIAVLVLVCAILIISCVVLSNRVSRLKTKLSQSKRQARSNGDFLSASSILWPSGMETWQKKAQAAGTTLDAMSLGDANTMPDEKNQLMLTPKEDSKQCNENKSTTSLDSKTMPTNLMLEI